ncbi:MAG: mono/diheme cytochrome c family protein, partial [Gammaproteobacteria bacterium]
MMKILGALVLLSLAPVAGAASPGQQDSQIFMRMLEQRCISCHGPDKRKGKLRLDTSAGIASVIEPYVAPESKLFLSITRAHDDLDRMPAEGDPCTDAEILAVLHWIN